MVESLRGHLNALNSVVSDNTRRRDDEWINKGVKPEKPAAEREQALLDRIDRAKTSAERDSLYMQLAFMAADKGEMKARDFASKIEDSELRKQVSGVHRCFARDDTPCKRNSPIKLWSWSTKAN